MVVDAYFKQVRTIWWWMPISNRCAYHMVADAYFKQVCTIWCPSCAWES